MDFGDLMMVLSLVLVGVTIYFITKADVDINRILNNRGISDKYHDQTTINMAILDKISPNDDTLPRNKRRHTKRSKYWLSPKKRKNKKYTKRSEYWTNGEAVEKARKARAVQAAKLKAKTTK